MTRPDPEALLHDLDPEQRDAVLATSGPVAILAGAGSGKTRVISRRTAYAVATGVVPAGPGAGRHVHGQGGGRDGGAAARRSASPGVTARTFHAHALSQLRFFWPLRHDGAPLPDLLDSKAPIVGRLARQLPGHYRFTPAKDLADEIEWAKARRVSPGAYERDAAAAGREPPIPLDLFVRLFDGYERAKVRANRIDFDDLLLGTVDLLEGDEDAAATVRARKRWFSVDEYQDTNPLQQRLLELWLGPDGRDLCVVGDEDQTIYTFTGATSAFLTGFADRWPGARVVELVRNYRSTPQVLELANRLIAAEGRAKRLVPTRDDGPLPTISRHRDAAEELAALTTWVRARIADGVAPAEVAVLVRINAQLAPIEEALTRAGVAYQVRGVRFYDRSEVRGALVALRRPALDARGPALAAAVRARWADAVGWAPDGAAEGDEARERQASLDTLLAIVDGIVAADPAADAATVISGPGGARAPRARGRRRRRQPAHLPPREGARVGRGVPAVAGGGDPADPPGAGRRRRARRRSGGSCTWASPGPGRTSRCRGRSAARRVAARAAASPAGSCWTCGRGPGPGSATCRPPADPVPRRRAATAPARCSRRCGRGGPRRRASSRCRPTSSPTTRRSRPSSSRAAVARRAPPGEGHGPGEGRAVRRRDPRDPRGEGPGARAEPTEPSELA